MALLKLPQSVQNTIWWQKSTDIDEKKDKKMLIKSILKTGNWEAMLWMRDRYSLGELRSVFKDSYSSEYSSKTLNFWETVLQTSPQFISRADKLMKV